MRELRSKSAAGRPRADQEVRPTLPAGLILLFACLPLGGQDFAHQLYPVLEKAGCRSCHNVDGVASATRLHFPEEDASPARI